MKKSLVMAVLGLVIISGSNAFAKSYQCSYEAVVRDADEKEDVNQKGSLSLESIYSKVDLEGTISKSHYEISIYRNSTRVDAELVKGHPESLGGAKYIAAGGAEIQENDKPFNIYAIGSSGSITFKCE